MGPFFVTQGDAMETAQLMDDTAQIPAIVRSANVSVFQLVTSYYLLYGIFYGMTGSW
jgi:hypothetical protein